MYAKYTSKVTKYAVPMYQYTIIYLTAINYFDYLIQS